jgi:hypothetical protein
LNGLELSKSYKQMKTKTKVLLATIGIVFLSVSAWAQPATVRFVSGHGHAFWVTNNTDKTLSITLTRIEIRVGSEWKEYSQPTDPGPGSLYFMYRNVNRGWLPPHEAGFGKLLAQNISLPKDGVWRAKVIVEEQLSGQEEVQAAAKLPVGTPIPQDVTYWGHPHEIFSEEIQTL